MPVSYHFKCANGHEFEAVAKLRSRCPECQQMTFRKSSSSLAIPNPSSIVADSKPTTPSLNILKPEEPPKSSSIGVKPHISGVKPNDESKSPKSVLKSKVVVQGRMPASKPPKKPVGPVRKVGAAHHSLPTVKTETPKGSHRHVVEAIPQGPYWTKVMKAFKI
jgi:hypothetical protein